MLLNLVSVVVFLYSDFEFTMDKKMVESIAIHYLPLFVSSYDCRGPVMQKLRRMI